MIETIKVSSRGQIVIPERIRKDLGIEEGTKMVLIKKGDMIFIEKEDKFLKKLNSVDLEKLGLLVLAEKSLSKDWLSKEDEKAWKDL